MLLACVGDYAPPQFASASINAAGDTLSILFTGTVRGTTTGFSIVAGIASRTLSAGSISGHTITFAISPTVKVGQSAAISYDAGTGGITNLDSFTDEAATNNSTVPVTITVQPVGSGISVVGTSKPRLAGMSATEVAFTDPGVDRLRMYGANVGTGSVTMTGDRGLSTDECDIVGLTSTTVAVQLINGVSTGLQHYTYSGSWGANDGSIANANADSALTRVNSNTLMISASTNGTYQWNGSTYTLLTSNIAGSGTGLRIGCYLSDGNIALFSPKNGGGYYLEKWNLSGTIWSQVGNTLTINTASGLVKSGATQLSASRIATYWSGATGGRVLRVYDFDGADWEQLGSDTAIGSASATDGAIEAFSSANFAFIDNVGANLGVYSFADDA